MMATVNDFFPSNYLRAADLDGRDLVLTIDRVESDEFENDGKKKVKPVIHFRDDGVKALVTNKTNFLLIAAICGQNTDAWSGKQICLYPEMVPFKGQVSEAIRAKRPPQAPVMANQAHTAAAAAQAPFATAPSKVERVPPLDEVVGDKIPY